MDDILRLVSLSSNDMAIRCFLPPFRPSLPIGVEEARALPTHSYTHSAPPYPSLGVGEGRVEVENVRDRIFHAVFPASLKVWYNGKDLDFGLQTPGGFYLCRSIMFVGATCKNMVSFLPVAPMQKKVFYPFLPLFGVFAVFCCF